MEKYKVVFHINESEKWGTVLANVNNLIKDLGKDNTIIEIVANGSAVINYVIDSNDKYNNFIDKMNSLYELGVKFIACKNSLIGNEVAENSIASFVTVVSAGVTELVKKQVDGYAYIKP